MTLSLPDHLEANGWWRRGLGDPVQEPELSMVSTALPQPIVSLASSNSLSACTQKFELPRWAINRRAAMFGLARIKELERNPAEAIGKLWSRSEASATSSIGIEISRTTDGATLSAAHSQRKKRQPSAGRYSRVKLSQQETIARNEPYKDSTAATNANADEPERP
jgi:hypothetical protein